MQGAPASGKTPSCEPGQGSVEQWAQKVRLLLQAWPENRVKELATRVALNTKRSAFQKLELRQQEVFTGYTSGAEKIIEIVAGQFGQIDLEKKYQIVERQDETSHSSSQS